mgnify:CR=1 FL=1
MNEIEQQYFEKLQVSRKEDLKVFSKPENRGFLTSVIDKYTESAHFIYELLQNADDALATKAEFRVTTEGLYFIHNGSVRFSISDPDTIEEDQAKGKLGHLNSITYTGFSTKDKEGTTNKIGKFGVGFKAVFQYTNNPHIYDDGMCFIIKDFFVPYLINDVKERKKGETIFYLPFDKKGVNSDVACFEISKRLRQLDNPILFLHNLKEVKWSDGESQGKYSKKNKESIDLFGIRCENIILENKFENKSDRLWLFTRDIAIENKSFPISVGYYVKNGKIDTDNRSNLYCFFPTKKKLGVCFIMHAPFVLTDSREGVREVKENEYLYEELAKLASDSLLCLRDIGLTEGHKPLLDDSLSKIVITKQPESEDPLNFFYSAFQHVLQVNNLFPSRKEGIYLSATKACICNQYELRKLLTKEQLEALTSKDIDFVYDNDKIDPDDLKYYSDMGVVIFNADMFADKISSSFLKSQPLDWMRQFYLYLHDHAKQLWKRQETRFGVSKRPPLVNKPIILLEDGRVSSTILHDIYLNNQGLPNTLQVNQELAQNEDIKSLFKAFGIKEEPDLIVHLQKSILPLFQQGSISIDDTDFLWKTFALLAQIYEHGSSDKREMLTCIKNSWKIVGVNFKGERKLCAIDEVYADDDELKLYFNNNSKIMFFDRSFYQIEEQYEQICSDLIKDLGLSTVPKLLITKRADCGVDYLNSYSLKHDSSWMQGLIAPYQEMLEKEVFQLLESNDYCRDIHATFYNIKMEGLGLAILNIKSIEDSIRIWEYIASSLNNQKKSNPLEIYCEIKYKPPYARDHRSFQPDSHPSMLMNLIRESTWIYNQTGQLCSPSDLYIEEINNRYDNIDKLANLLGIVHSPRVEDNKHLEQCSEETQHEVELGRQMKSWGLGNYDLKYLAELVRKDENAKRLEEEERQKQRLSITKSRTDVFQREPQKEYTAEELFDKRPEPITHKNVPKTTLAEEREKIEIEQQEEREEAEHKQELCETASTCDKYSFLWYKSLLELEYLNSGESSFGKKGVRISFGKMEAEPGSSKMIILKQPSKHIPQTLEDCGDITVTFHFNNIERKCLTFEVANVKDYTLRLKCKNESMDEAALLLNNASHLLRAEIDTGFPIQLIDKLLKAYEELPYEDNYSFKQNINPNLHFVFGPPGTGKTTYLANELKRLMSENYLNPTSRKSKILVLCPTNKACDVLLQKVEDTCSSEEMDCFARFKVTGEEKLEPYLCDSTLPIIDLEKACIVSTMARFHYDGFDDAELKDVDWDYIVIDEASMIPLAYVTYVIDRCPHAKIIIAGDPFQIEPIVHEELWKDENIYTMVGLNDFTNPKTEPYKFNITNLTTQYRSVPAIGELFSYYAYNGALTHHRTEDSLRKLHLDGLEIKPVNFVTFPVKKYETLYRSHRLSTSNVHIYSVLLVYEFMKYLIEQISKNHKGDAFKVGVICPYRAQAEMINKIWEQRTDKAENVEVSIGTVHGFQGDECDIILAVYNPPASGMKMMADKTFMNRKNILNVAVSRAKDYLFLLMPNKDYECYNNLAEIRTLGRIIVEKHITRTVFTSDYIEKVVFEQPGFIEENAFVTTHQLTNVYTEPSTRYEVRIDENSVDVQLGN